MKRSNNILTKDEIIDIIQSQKSFLSEKFFITEIGLFGSFIRGEQDVHSDIDILIDFDRTKPFSLFDLMDLKDFLSSKLGCNVDLALKRSLKPVIGYFIMQEVQMIN